MLLLPKQTRQKNTGTKVNFINGKTEEQRNWSDMSKVTQELTTYFLLSIPVSIPKETCLLKSVPAEQFFDGHSFEYNRNIWIERGGTRRSNSNAYVSGKKVF